MNVEPVLIFDSRSFVAAYLFGPVGENPRLIPVCLSPARSGGSNDKVGRQLADAGRTTRLAHSRPLSVRHVEVEFHAGLSV
jgi:hypothetical protein